MPVKSVMRCHAWNGCLKVASAGGEGQASQDCIQDSCKKGADCQQKGCSNEEGQKEGSKWVCGAQVADHPTAKVFPNMLQKYQQISVMSCRCMTYMEYILHIFSCLQHQERLINAISW